MSKRKVTPFIVATILTAGIAATGMHRFKTQSIKLKNQAPVTYESTSRSIRKKKEENTSHESNESVNINKTTSENIHPLSNSDMTSESTSITNNKNEEIKSNKKGKTVTVQKRTFLHRTINKSPNINITVNYPNGNMLVNGTRISSQLNNNSEIYNTTQNIINGCSNDYQKAQAIYVWISRHITYNKVEEAAVMNNDENSNGSAIKTFTKKDGICEDFSTLYAVMAHDAGLSSRVIAGEGYGNNSWGGHAWNQVYIPSKGWINVDCTFANAYISLINKNNLPFNSIGLLSEQPYYTYLTKEYSYKIYTEDYFNTSNFSTTHKDAKIIAQLNG